ncbi:MAG: hypothetical protein V4858_18205 [Pseudomonadota bacterium]
MTNHTHPSHAQLAPAYGDSNDLSTYQAEGSTIACLMAAYPHLFQNGGPHWSDLPEGWYGIATEFMDLVDRHLGPGLAPYFRISQCKEKFASLRVYWTLCGRGYLHVDIQTGQGQVQHLILPPETFTPTGDDSPYDEDGNEIDEAGGSHRRLNPLVAVAMECARASIRAEEQAILGRSMQTCQNCAAPGRMRLFSWRRTLCDTCAAAHTQAYGEQEITLAERYQGTKRGGQVGGQGPDPSSPLDLSDPSSW